MNPDEEIHEIDVENLDNISETIEYSTLEPIVETPEVVKEKRQTRRSTDIPRKQKVRPSRRARSPPPNRRHKTPRCKKNTTT
jgi:hypothetical protein